MNNSATLTPIRDMKTRILLIIAFGDSENSRPGRIVTSPHSQSNDRWLMQSNTGAISFNPFRRETDKQNPDVELEFTV